MGNDLKQYKPKETVKDDKIKNDFMCQNTREKQVYVWVICV